MRSIFMIILLSVATCSVAQTTAREQVAATVEQFKKALIDSDGKMLDQLTAPELSYGHSSGKIEDKAAFVQSLTSGASDFVTIDLTNQTIRLAGNTAIVRHQLSGEINDSGKTGTVKLGVMLIWQKQQNQWKLLARQAFKMP